MCYIYNVAGIYRIVSEINHYITAYLARHRRLATDRYKLYKTVPSVWLGSLAETEAEKRVTAMSLALLQGYSSDEEEVGARASPSSPFLSDDEARGGEDGEEEDWDDDEEEALKERSRRMKRQRSLADASGPPANSFLPSALDAFDEVPFVLCLLIDVPRFGCHT